MAELLTVQSGDELEKRFSGIFWGHSGTGKTVFSATAPRPILYLGWDIEGWQSVKDTTDFNVINLADADTPVVEMFMNRKGRIYDELLEHCKTHNIKTIINDSITTYVSLALDHAATIGQAYARKNEKISRFNPGWTGYGIRTTLLHSYIMNMGLFCSKHGLNCIFIGHEDQPKEEGEGEARRILYTTMRLGGDNGFEIPKDVREVWHFGMDETGSNYRISLRPFPVKAGSSALVRPMKSTMINTTKVKNINWQEGDSNDSLERWMEIWKTKGQLVGEDF